MGGLPKQVLMAYDDGLIMFTGGCCRLCLSRAVQRLFAPHMPLLMLAIGFAGYHAEQRKPWLCIEATKEDRKRLNKLARKEAECGMDSPSPKAMKLAESAAKRMFESDEAVIQANMKLAAALARVAAAGYNPQELAAAVMAGGNRKDEMLSLLLAVGRTEMNAIRKGPEVSVPHSATVH